MKGLRLKDKKSFHHAISSITRELDGFQWLLESESVNIPENDNSSKISQLIDGDCNWYYSNENIIKLYSKAINEDWNTIFSFKADKSGIRDWARNYWKQKDRAKYITNNCETVFINVDSAYWEIYSNNDNVLNSIRKQFPVLELPELTTENPGI